MARLCKCGAVGHEFDSMCAACGRRRRGRGPEFSPLPFPVRAVLALAAAARARPVVAAAVLVLICAAVVTAFLFHAASPRTLLRTAEAAFEQGRYGEAIAAFGEYLEVRPGSAEAHYRRGRALMLAGRAAEGLTDIERAVEHDGSHVAARLILARRAEAAGDAEAALRHYEGARRCLEAGAGRLRALLALGRTGAAMAAGRDYLLAREPEARFARAGLALGELLLFRSFLFLRDRDREDAMRLFRQVATALRDRVDADSLAIRVRALLRLSRHREALYVALRPELEGPAALVFRAGGHDGQGDREGAVTLLREYRARASGVAADLAIAQFWMERGETGHLRGALSAARADGPEDVGLLALDAFTRAVDGEPAAAFEMLAPRIKEIALSSDALRLFVRVARLAEVGERALVLLSKEGEASEFPLARAALRMGVAGNRVEAADVRGSDPLDPESLLIAGEIRHRFAGTQGAPATGEAARYVDFARRLAASRMSTSSDRLRREAALRGYAASAAELRRALKEMQREAM